MVCGVACDVVSLWPPTLPVHCPHVRAHSPRSHWLPHHCMIVAQSSRMSTQVVFAFVLVADVFWLAAVVAAVAEVVAGAAMVVVVVGAIVIFVLGPVVALVAGAVVAAVVPSVPTHCLQVTGHFPVSNAPPQ